MAEDLAGFTDGSVTDPRHMRQGGGGYVLFEAHRAERGTHRGLCAAGGRCTSYVAELSAMLKPLDDLIAGHSDEGVPIRFPAPKAPTKCEIRIALDSQSAIRALEKGPSAQTGALDTYQEAGTSV